MLTGKPSQTALSAAAHRAAHQVVEGGRIFRDPTAIRILGSAKSAAFPDEAELLARRPMRLFIAVRSRVAEERMLAAVERGVAQIVVLGAGLDSTAYRGILAEDVRVFEVDHPATQAWKNALLAEAEIAAPASLHFVPVDFEHDDLGTQLSASGFDSAAPAFFIWLGVVPYLTQPAILGTLRFVAALPGGAEIVFDYINPPDALDDIARRAYDARASRVGAIGEAWISHFDTDALHRTLQSLRFVRIDDLGAAEIAARFFPGTVRGHGGHVLHAATERVA